MRQWLAANPDVVVITVPVMQRALGGSVHVAPHLIEQAMERLNKSGELSHAHRHDGHCCGDCRASRYYVRRPEKRR